MVRNIIAIVLVFLVIVVVVFALEWLPKSKFSNRLDNLITALEKDDFDKALSSFKEINGFWLKRQLYIGLENSFEKVEDVDISLRRLGFFIETKNKNSALLETRLLGYHWKEIGE